MKRIWSYISVLLFGIITGLVIAVKFLSADAIEINIDKIKNKRTSGNNEVIVPISVNNPRKRKEKKQPGENTTRKQKRKQRKFERSNKKL